MAEVPQLVDDNKKHPKLYFGGKLFTRNNVYNGRTNWRCWDRDCAGTAQSVPSGVNNQLEITLQSNHSTCSTTDVDAIVMYYKNKVLKQIVANTSAIGGKRGISVAYDSVAQQVNQLHPEQAGRFPTEISLISAAKRARRKNYPILPKTLQQIIDMVIPEKFQKTIAEDPPVQFLIHKDAYQIPGETDPTFMLIFCTERDLVTLAEATWVGGDGTFKICPKDIYQIFILNVMQGSENHRKSIALLWCLFTRKTEKIYRKFFSWLASAFTARHLQVNWRFFMCDFEKALINAITREFPLVTTKGCWFHHCSLIYKNLVDIGLKVEYNRPDSAVAAFARLVMKLVFLPAEHMAPVFDQLVATYQGPNIDRFVASYKEHWLGTIGKKRSVKSVLGYNHFNSEDMKTNNNQEGYNKRLLEHIGLHPDYFKCIMGLQRDNLTVIDDENDAEQENDDESEDGNQGGSQDENEFNEVEFDELVASAFDERLLDEQIAEYSHSRK